MTHAQKRGIAISLATTVGGSLILWLANVAWHTVTPRATFDAHVTAEELHHARDDARMERLESLSLDTYCALKPRDRRCK